MTNDNFTEAARAEAERRHNRIARRNKTADEWLDEGRASGFTSGAEWARTHLAAQEPTDGEVEAARTEVREALRDQYKDRYNLGRHDSINIGDEIDIDETAEMVARAALSAARAARRDGVTR